MNKILILLMITALAVIVSALYYSYNTKSNKKQVDTMMKSNLDTFLFKDCTPKNVLRYCEFIGITHPCETTAQMCGESDYFHSQLAISKNNLAGFQTSTGYITFKHWTNCVQFMKQYQSQRGLKKGMNYFSWLNQQNYHQVNPVSYNKFVQSIMKMICGG